MAVTSETVSIRYKAMPDGSLKEVGRIIKQNTSFVNRSTKANQQHAHSVGEQDRATKAVAGATSNATKAFAKQSQGMGGLVAAYATIAANAWAVTAAFTALKNAADLSILFKGAEFLGIQTGQDLVGMAEGLKAVTDGMLSFAEAQKQVAIISAAGFGKKEILAIGEAAKNASRALGRDLKDSMDRLSRGIIKAEPEVLDELGIILRLEDATKKYAQANGIAVSSLTSFDRQQAVMNEVLEQAERKYGKLGKSQDLVNQFTLLQANATDVLNSSLTAIASVITPIAGYFNDNAFALKAMMAIFTGILLKQALPILTSFGDGIKNWGISAQISAKKTEDAIQRQTRAFKASQKASLAQRTAATSAFEDVISTLHKDKRITKGMQKIMLGPLKGNDLRKAMANNIAASFRLASSVVAQDKTVQSGFFKGASSGTALTEMRKEFEKSSAALTVRSRTLGETIKNTLNAATQKVTLGFQNMKVAASKSFAAIGTSWTNTASTIAKHGFFPGISAALSLVDRQARQSNVGLSIFSSSMAKATVITKAATVALGGFIRLAGTLLAGFAIFGLIKEFFQSDSEKEYARALEEIESASSSLLKTVNSLAETYKLLGESIPENFGEQANNARILANSARTLQDSLDDRLKADTLALKIAKQITAERKKVNDFAEVQEDIFKRMEAAAARGDFSIQEAFNRGDIGAQSTNIPESGLNDANQALKVMLGNAGRVKAVLSAIVGDPAAFKKFDDTVTSAIAKLNKQINLLPDELSNVNRLFSKSHSLVTKAFEKQAAEMKTIPDLIQAVSTAWDKTTKTGIGISKYSVTLEKLTSLQKSLDSLTEENKTPLLFKDLAKLAKDLGISLVDAAGTPITTVTGAFDKLNSVVSTLHTNLITIRGDLAKFKKAGASAQAFFKVGAAERKNARDLAQDQINALHKIGSITKSRTAAEKLLTNLAKKRSDILRDSVDKNEALLDKMTILGSKEETLVKLQARQLINDEARAIALQPKIDKLRAELEVMSNQINLNRNKVATSLIVQSVEERAAQLQHPKSLADAWESATGRMAESVKAPEEALRDGLVSGMSQLTDGLVEMAMAADFSMKSFRQMAASMVRDLGSMIAKQLIFNALSGFAGLVTGPNVGTTAAEAQVHNSFLGLLPQANGGILTRPTAVLAAEAGMNEAFVPLPDGRTIPVTMSGGGSGTNNVSVTVNIVEGQATSEQSGDANSTGQQLGKLISGAVQRELIEQSRPGGLLSRRR